MIPLSATISIPPSNIAGVKVHDDGSITVFFCHELGDVKQMKVRDEYVGYITRWVDGDRSGHWRAA